MMSKFLIIFIVICAQIIYCVNLFAQEENVIIKNYNLELAKESPPHKMLSKLEGKWDLNYKLWINPNADPEEGSGTADAEVILGGRFLQVNMVYSIYEKEFTSEHIFGYDTEVNKFSLFSIDEFSTNAIFEYGDFDIETESIVFTGTDSTSSNPSTDEKSYKYRIELYIPTEEDVNEFGFSTYFLNQEGKWVPLMETSFIKAD
jgi:hypothetical protein